MNTRHLITYAGLLLGLLVSAVAHGAEAQSAAIEAEVLIALGREEPGEIDPALRDHRALTRPPFSAFKSMALLSRPTLSLEPGKDAVIDLPNGRKMRIQVSAVLPNGRFRVKVSINRPNQKDYLPEMQVIASEDDPFFVVGQAHEGGTLVIGVKLTRPRAE